MIQPIPLLLRTVDPFLPDALASKEARARVMDLCARLPTAWSQTCLECRLRGDPDRDRVDLLVCATRENNGQEALAAYLSEEKTPHLLGSSVPFLTTWSSPGSRIADQVPVVWLEYDLPRGTQDPRPFVFMTLDPSYPGMGPPVATADVIQLARDGIALMAGETDAAAMSTLEHCARVLPRGGSLLHLTTLRQRGRADLRVSAVLPHGHIGSWLDDIGWPGDRPALEHALALAGPVRGRRAIHLEVGDGVRPSIAFDCTLRDRGGWGHLLDRLAAAGLCDAQRARAAVEWIGTNTIDTPDTDWPIQVQRWCFFKIRVLSDASLEVKAYLLIDSQYLGL